MSEFRKGLEALQRHIDPQELICDTTSPHCHLIVPQSPLIPTHSDPPDPSISPPPKWCPSEKLECPGVDPGWLYDCLTCGDRDAGCQRWITQRGETLTRTIEQLREDPDPHPIHVPALAFWEHVAGARHMIWD